MLFSHFFASGVAARKFRAGKLISHVFTHDISSGMGSFRLPICSMIAAIFVIVIAITSFVYYLYQTYKCFFLLLLHNNIL